MSNPTQLGRTRYRAFADVKPRNLTVEEHRSTAQKLHRIASELRSVRELLRSRYPDAARCRTVVGNADADIAALRLTMAAVLNSEIPSAGVDYTADDREQGKVYGQ